MAVTHEADARDLDAKVYEVSFVVPAVNGEEGAVEAFERVKSLISSLGGTQLAEGAPNRVQLASELCRLVGSKIERHTDGFFSWIQFEATPNVAPVLHDAVKKDKEILRHLIIRTVRDSGPAPRFLSSDRLEGETIRKRETVETGKGPVSEEELDKSIEQLVGDKI